MEIILRKPSLASRNKYLKTENWSDPHILSVNYLDPVVLNRPGRVTQNIKSYVNDLTPPLTQTDSQSLTYHHI